MLQRPRTSDGADATPVRGLRSMGSGTDVLSMSAKSSRAALPHANPAPMYVSAIEAETLVLAEIERPVKISDSVIHLVNGFLDQILYDILSKSHSTILSAVRYAVPIVLRPRLGRLAVRAGDEELLDYVEQEVLEQVQAHVPVLDPRADFDVDLAWKLTRLRCMVYAKLGEMEEEDEEEYLDDDDLRDHLHRVRDSTRKTAGIVPASAIFLTTVLEFIAEQALCIAAQHARKRDTWIRSHFPAEAPTHVDPAGASIISLEEIDMGGLGKEGPLIRLWRSWKGNVRASGSMSSRPTTPNVMSPTSPESPNREWKVPTGPAFSTIQEEHSPSIRPATSPTNIPLPMTENDVEEIEVPGLAPTFEDEDDTPTEKPALGERRPSSMLLMPGIFPVSTPHEETDRPVWGRKRSQSLPSSPQSRSRKTVQRDPTQQAPLDLQEERPTADALDGPRQRSSKPPGEASRMSNAMSDTVATIAGALNIEASRALRRDRPIYAPDERRAPAPGSQTGGPHLRPDQRQLAEDPEDLALSSADERDGVDADHPNPRDSGFGVASSEDELPIQGQTPSVPDHDPSASHADRASHHAHARHVNHDRSLDDGTDARPMEQGYATHPGTDPATDHRGLESHPVRGTPGSSIPTSNAMANRLPGLGLAAATAAANTAFQNRTTSLENQGSASAHPPTASRIPQQVSSSTRSPDADNMIDHASDRTPRYAAPPFTIGKDGRPSTAGSATARKHLLIRSDQEDNTWRTTPPDEADKTKKSFDVLIDSDETLHYTLTPKSARAGHDASKPKVKSQTQELADFFRNTAPPGEDPIRPKSSRSAKDVLTGRRANAPSSPKPPLPVNAKNAASPSSKQSVNSPARAKNPLGEPRDARMGQNTTRDLADYARSTGPEHEMQLPKALASRSGTTQGVRAADGLLREKDSDAALREADGVDTRPGTTSSKPSSRLKFQARDARAPRTAESSELIDFIREGPPRAPGDHRIDRKVAPFRTTMDSDDLNGLTLPREPDTNGRNSDGSAQESAVTVKSMPSSMNSRTGLLDATNRATNSKFTNGIGAPALPVSRQPVILEKEGMPKKNRRKVRDPYAIDLSDEEGDLDDLLNPHHRRTEEESMVDFLRNTAPPPEMLTKPILPALPENHHAAAGDHPDRNGVGPGTNGARAESPHLTQVGSKLDKYRPTQPTHAAHVERNRQKIRAEPRDATVAPASGTADLAAYLKSSGPPPGSETPLTKINTVGKDQASFLKFFQRRGSVKR